MYAAWQSMAKGEVGARKRKRQATPIQQSSSTELQAYMQQRDPGTEYTLLSSSPKDILNQMKALFESTFPHLQVDMQVRSK